MDRLLSNGKLDVWEAFAWWVPYLIGARKEVTVSLDWTSFAADGQEVVALSTTTGHGRSTALVWQTVLASELKGNRNDQLGSVRGGYAAATARLTVSPTLPTSVTNP